MDYIRHGWEAEDEPEEKLAQEDGDKEAHDVDGEDTFFEDGLVAVEDGWDDEDWGEKRGEFREEVVGVLTVDDTVIETPEQDWSERDFDVFPGAFVDRGEEADEAVVFREIVEEVGESADDRKRKGAD